MGLLDILNQYTGQATGSDDEVGNHFDQVARQADPHDVGNGVSAAMRSDATPPFGQMIGHLFGQSSPDQQAGLVNQLLHAIGPAALSGAAGGALGRILGMGEGAAASGTATPSATARPTSTATPNASPTVTPAQASQLSPSEVEAMAAHAHQQDESIVDKLGGFYAQHPQLVKSLGAAALAVALGHMRSRS